MSDCREPTSGTRKRILIQPENQVSGLFSMGYVETSARKDFRTILIEEECGVHGLNYQISEAPPM